jgi:hypothetical protein
MSKFLRAYLVQGNKKYEGISSVDMTVKVNGGDIWEIELKIDNAQKLCKDCDNNKMFRLHIESTSMKDSKPMIETTTGEILITEIEFLSQTQCRVNGIASNIRWASREGITREKVQFT